MGEKMTPALDDKLRCLQSLLQQMGASVACKTVGEARDALLTAHLTQPAQAVDVPKGWSAENLERCCRELNGLIKLASDYDFDEMTVATFETSIACILVCLATLPNANGKDTPDAAR